ncbi:MAG: hypothetical protein HN580_29875 [Deltaproteobacteria bacterium]|nr:hypothetical protein [Deltaproteobacteria bacterium]
MLVLSLEPAGIDLDDIAVAEACGAAFENEHTSPVPSFFRQFGLANSRLKQDQF